jgi:hypothetical protein
MRFLRAILKEGVVGAFDEHLPSHAEKAVW